MKFKIGDEVISNSMRLLVKDPNLCPVFKLIRIYCYPYETISDVDYDGFPDTFFDFMALRDRIEKLRNLLITNDCKKPICVGRNLDDLGEYIVCTDNAILLLEEEKDKWLAKTSVGGYNFSASRVDRKDWHVGIEAAHLNSSKISKKKESDFALVKTTREQCLDDAKKCVCGDRDKQYGSPEYNFDIISDYWTTYLHERLFSPKKALEPVDVANMMCLFKLGRITTSESGGTYDSYVDLAGYAACGAEMNKEGK